MYVSLETPFFENAVHAYNLHLQGYIDRIKKVERIATRIPFGFEIPEYEERLKRFNLTTFKDR